MRRAIMIAVLGLAGCSSDRVRTIGFHQYLIVSADWRQAGAKATETCAKLGRKWIGLGIPAGSPLDQFRFECVNSYEIVPAGKDTYRIRVLSGDMQLTDVTLPGSKDIPATTVRLPDVPAADAEATRRATQFCARTNQVVKVTGGTFDMGPGLETAFKCAAQGIPSP